MTGNSEAARAVELHQRSPSASLASARGGDVYDEPDMLVYVSGSEVPFTNGVQMATLSPRDADVRIAHVARLFRTRKLPATWWIGPSSTPRDLAQRLRRAGFEPEEELPWMTRELDGPVVAATVPGLVIERVNDPVEQRIFLDVMQAGFDMPDSVRRELHRSASIMGYAPNAPWVRFLGRVDGRAVGSSGLMHFGGVAGIYNVATVPEYRRRGIAAAMTAAAMEHGRLLGYGLSALGTSERGRGVYEGRGFREACVLRPYVIWP